MEGSWKRRWKGKVWKKGGKEWGKKWGQKHEEREGRALEIKKKNKKVGKGTEDIKREGEEGRERQEI